MGYGDSNRLLLEIEDWHYPNLHLFIREPI